MLLESILLNWDTVIKSNEPEIISLATRGKIDFLPPKQRVEINPTLDLQLKQNQIPYHLNTESY